MLVFFHTFDSSSLKFKESHSSANTDDRYKGFALSSHEHTCFICINTKQDRRLTPICNFQRGWRPSEQPGQREAASALFLMPHEHRNKAAKLEDYEKDQEAEEI